MRPPVDPFGEHFLADSGLAAKDDAEIAWRDALGHLEDMSHGIRGWAIHPWSAGDDEARGAGLDDGAERDRLSLVRRERPAVEASPVRASEVFHRHRRAHVQGGVCAGDGFVLDSYLGAAPATDDECSLDWKLDAPTLLPTYDSQDTAA
jgi:hypothetical protein